jgi:hypothetical protein
MLKWELWEHLLQIKQPPEFMNKYRRSFWLTLSLGNLCIVAFLGFTLRSKILFSLPFIDFRNLESAHSHFAFAGWVGLALMTLMIYDLLPAEASNKKVYQWILGAIEVSSIGMAVFFPFYGYNLNTIFFSSLYIFSVVFFSIIFISDIIKTSKWFLVKLLSISALLSLMLSFLGTIGLIYIIATHKGSSLLYRDSIYTFLHFQYNGFFTLSIFSLLFNQLINIINKGVNPSNKARYFAISLCLSIIPSLFLSLLWHNLILFYILAAFGCICILISVYFFAGIIKNIQLRSLFKYPLARTFFVLSSVSFCLKMLLHVGTIFPKLGNAVYGDRPVIIGFLHLVFLGFVSFYILSSLIEAHYFNKKGKLVQFPFLVFAFGIISNELILMLQGLGILFSTNFDVYKWLLWLTSIVLFTGAFLIICLRLNILSSQKMIINQPEVV